jgi:hypothetical protein
MEKATETVKRATFKNPHVFKKQQGKRGLVIDHKASENYVMLTALGQPKVIYAIKSNTYWKDIDCENKFADEEVQALGLPIPIEIANARKRMMKAALEANEEPDMDAIYRVTTPLKLELPQRIKDRIVETTAEERIIRGINRSALGGK